MCIRPILLLWENNWQIIGGQQEMETGFTDVDVYPKSIVCVCLSVLPAIARFVHEAPLHASGEPSSTSPPQTRYLDLI